MQRHRTADVADREIAVQEPLVAHGLDVGAAERDLREALDVEEIGAPQVLVAPVIAGLDAGGGQGDLDRGLLGYLGDVDLAADVGEATPHLGDHQVAGDELDRRVGGVEGVGARLGQVETPVLTDRCGGGHVSSFREQSLGNDRPEKPHAGVK